MIEKQWLDAIEDKLVALIIGHNFVDDIKKYNIERQYGRLVVSVSHRNMSLLFKHSTIKFIGDDDDPKIFVNRITFTRLESALAYLDDDFLRDGYL